ncbi:MAG: anthranilate synthase component I [Candidatus Omnitrophota bacterium]|jgi:anthranilate synthase component 1
MITPDFKTFSALARRGNVIAVSKTVSADLETPVSCFMKLAGRERYAFLLESAEQKEQIGRYSFIGLSPAIVLEGRGAQTRVTDLRVPAKRTVPRHLVDEIDGILADCRFANQTDYPHLCAGFVGYFGYENVEAFEDIRLRRKPGPKLPDGLFVMPGDLIVFDHYRKTLSLVALVFLEGTGKSPKTAYRGACKRIEGWIVKLKRPLHSRPSEASARLRPKSNMTRGEFMEKVERIKAYIRAGDCIQVVLSQRFEMPGVSGDFRIYRALRSVNPSPYMFYFRAANLRLIGSSPEMLVKKTKQTAELRPIAGTRPRGRSPAEDLRLEEGLRKSVKEMAEHVMLVDLGRNDLGRVCRFESVRVGQFARVERYSHVMHLVSDVAGRLKPNRTASDLLRAVFPAGTLSGAPKIRAMQIIDELESEKRGPYGGCLGYFGYDGDMDMCIVIRTLVCDGRGVYLQAGAGIVKDSNPAREYAETVNKAKALVRAIEMSGDFQ